MQAIKGRCLSKLFSWSVALKDRWRKREVISFILWESGRTRCGIAAQLRAYLESNWGSIHFKPEGEFAFLSAIFWVAYEGEKWVGEESQNRSSNESFRCQVLGQFGEPKPN